MCNNAITWITHNTIQYKLYKGPDLHGTWIYHIMYGGGQTEISKFGPTVWLLFHIRAVSIKKSNI